MNTTSHKTPALWGTIVLVMGLLYACADADSGGDSGPPTLTAGDVTYDSIAHGTAGTVNPKSSKTSNFSGMTFSIASISTHTGTQVPPTIAEDGTITVAATTTAGSYRVTMTPDGSTILGDPFTVDFYVSVTATDLADLDTKLQTAITNYGPTGDFNYIDTSAVTDMSYLFASGFTPGTGVENTARTYVQGFNGDISRWDVSNVENFSGVFLSAAVFNQDIGGWDVSSGTDFSDMFSGARAFNNGGSPDIGKWVVSAGTSFGFMFSQASSFNQDIGGWDVSFGTDFSSMFFQAVAFNQNIGRWTVSAVKNFSAMFYGATVFNQDISGWTVSAGTDFRAMFSGATAFNQDLSSWNLASTVTKTDMFKDSGVTSPPAWYTQ